MYDGTGLEDFSSEVTMFFEQNAEKKASLDADVVWGEGDDEVSIFVEVDAEVETWELAQAKGFRAARYDAGLGWITGPIEFGGRELGHAHESIFNAISDQYIIPTQRFFGIGLGMVGPTILLHAQEAIKRRYLRKLFRGDVIGCQLFSEPEAGSDLASVSTRAERDGDGWVINGQKVWTTGAHYADIGEILVRTDADAPRHEGLSAFVLDMKSPGVEVRPLRQMTGGSSFNEVFFSDVRIPDENRLGEINGGWQIALTTLLNERASIGAGGAASARLEFLDHQRLIRMMRHWGVNHDAVLRQEFARLYSALQIASWSGRRAMEGILATGVPGPELSMTKLVRTNNLQSASDFICNVLGPRLSADTGEWGTFAWTRFALGVPGLRIAGGSDEIQRKIIGEQVLGLPKEPQLR